MNKPSTLDEQIARAQRAIACWPEGRVRMMQLQGTDNFCSLSPQPSDSRGEKPNTQAPAHQQRSVAA